MIEAEKLLKLDKTTLTLEAIGDGEIRVNSSSWDDPKVILADEVLEARAMGKRMLVLEWPKFPPDSDEAMFDPVFPGVMRHGACICVTRTRSYNVTPCAGTAAQMLQVSA